MPALSTHICMFSLENVLIYIYIFRILLCSINLEMYCWLICNVIVKNVKQWKVKNDAVSGR